jgi:DNA repair exonuclease SbcCD nuclease subunit
MISKIAHLGDIHIRKTPTRNEEYDEVFQNIITSLAKKKPDRIVIAGDLVHDYLDLQGEQLILAHKFLNSLTKIAPVRITRGNHDCRKKNLKRVDSVKAIVETLNNPNVIYYDRTGMHIDDNIMWAVWHHGDAKNNPWKTKEGKKIDAERDKSTFTFIDLFHDPVNGCKTTTGFDMKSKSLYKVSDFKGDISMFGDIHRMQYLNKEKTKAYCGSLIAQDFSEGDDNFHGYLLWDINTKKVEEVPIANDYSFKNIRITPYTDFNDLDFEIENPTKHMRIRFIWGTLPQARAKKENERNLIEYIKAKYGDKAPILFAHKNEFVEADKMDVNENVTLQNISNVAVQHEIFKEYLSKIGVEEAVINDIIALDVEILKEIDIANVDSIEWDIIKFGGKNFMSYGELDIDWREMDGLFQITGINTAGKTTIMKLISYILFGITLETESRKKFGDTRFVNNRNGAAYCEGYLIVEANGEYYGIKKKTEITKNKSGEITGAPTTLNYYLLSSPDEEMNDTNLVEKLDEDRRVKTQQKINIVIGTYDNFMRIVMTTSDTLNRILSNDMAIFIDSLLFDSGLDIFDKKLEGSKVYQKRVNELSRITCNVDFTTQQNATLAQEITTIEGEINEIEGVKLPDIQGRIDKGKEYIETLTKKLFKIDPFIYNLNVKDTQEDINLRKRTISDYNARKSVLEESIIPLKETYDEVKLFELLKKKEEHRTGEYGFKLEIKALEQTVRDEEHQIEIIGGDVFRLKQEGADLKAEILELRESKICPTCKQPLSAEHQIHIDEKAKEKTTKMFGIAGQIRHKENIDKKTHQEIIDAKKKEIDVIKEKIQTAALAMESVLKKIGELTNDKNDVEKRKELQTELNQIPTLIQNEELKINILQQKIDNHENSKIQIEENQKTELTISAAKSKLKLIEAEEADEKENVFIKKTAIGEKQIKIKNNETILAEFKIQEHRDMVMNLYKKCVHRDGIPRQMLINYIIPKINLVLDEVLSVAQFKVWLDVDDLRPKLVYNCRPAAIIDCISASGKERTFASVVLKFALNQINVKAKPTIFLLDEVMGKLDEEGSVEEFIEILQIIKKNMKKMLVIEHKYEINPDYLINVTLNEDGISSLEIE